MRPTANRAQIDMYLLVVISMDSREESLLVWQQRGPTPSTLDNMAASHLAQPVENKVELPQESAVVET